MSNDKKPAIRFKDYSDDWEHRKLSELLYLSSERNDGSYTRDDVLAASLGTELQKKHIYFGLRATDESVKNYKVVLPNDVIYTKSPIKGFPNGIIRTSKGENGIVPTLYCVYHSIDVINPSIIQACFESKERLDAYLIPLVNIGARNNVNITDKEFLEGAICIPKDKAEQDKIVDVLERLSNLITLHQRKYDKLQNLKKAMLEKMFPKNGSNVPEIRFKGFTDAWEQRKLSELSEKTFGGGTPKTSNESFWKGNIPWIQSSDLIEGSLFDVEPRKYISQEAVDKSATKLVPENSVAIVTRVGVGKLAFMPFSYATSQDFLSLSALKIEPQFTVYTLYKKLQSELNAVQGTSIKGVTKDELLAKEVMIPCYKEQEKIGSYLHSLDHLITLHQRELEKLKNIKKAMLEKMFV